MILFLICLVKIALLYKQITFKRNTKKVYLLTFSPFMQIEVLDGFFISGAEIVNICTANTNMGDKLEKVPTKPISPLNSVR